MKVTQMQVHITEKGNFEIEDGNYHNSCYGRMGWSDRGIEVSSKYNVATNPFEGCSELRLVLKRNGEQNLSVYATQNECDLHVELCNTWLTYYFGEVPDAIYFKKL